MQSINGDETMMPLFKNILFPFGRTQKRLEKIRQQQAEQQRQMERDVCASIARGNISLQNGEYITQEDMDKVQAELEAFLASDKLKW